MKFGSSFTRDGIRYVFLGPYRGQIRARAVGTTTISYMPAFSEDESENARREERAGSPVEQQHEKAQCAPGQQRQREHEGLNAECDELIRTIRALRQLAMDYYSAPVECVIKGQSSRHLRRMTDREAQKERKRIYAYERRMEFPAGKDRVSIAAVPMSAVYDNGPPNHQQLGLDQRWVNAPEIDET
jgi:hypothetical protein